MRSLLIGLLVTLCSVSFLNGPYLLAFENSSSVVFPVGVLGEKWQFPSDHLPVGLSVGSVHLASWNVLNSRYIYHILTNQQGLKDSLITSANFPLEKNSKLTLRESLIVDQVLEMIDHPTHPRSLIALQEVGKSFFEELKKKLPDRMVSVTTTSDELGQGDLFIYDSCIFEWMGFYWDRYKIRPSNSYMTLVLKEIKTGLVFHAVQSHIPAAPGISTAARKEFVQEILSNFNSDSITIIMGDMNRSPDFLMTDFKEVANDMGFKRSPIKNLWIPYATHIDCYKQASWIDNLFFYLPSEAIKIEVSQGPEAFFPDFSSVINLLKSLRPISLEASFEIWSKVNARDATVVHGAPGSGKTEQVMLALKSKKFKVFNLKENFLKSYFCESKIEDPSEKEKVAVEYAFSHVLQELEYEWLNNAFFQIVEDLAFSEAKIVAFDDFDLPYSKNLSPYKLSTLLTVAAIGKKLVENGKKVVFVIHDLAFSSSAFWEEISQNLDSSVQDVVKTRYLTPDEERYLLDRTGLSEEAKQFYQQWASGIPSAYLCLMQALFHSKEEGKVIEIELDELMQQSLKVVENTWKALMANQLDEVIEKLLDLAASDEEKDECEMAKHGDSLIETGLVLRKNGVIMMPALVRSVLKPHFREF